MQTEAFNIVNASFEKIAKLTEEEKREYEQVSKAVSDKRLKRFEEDSKEIPKKTIQNVGSVGAIGAGAGGVQYAHKKGYVDGRRKLYHNTSKENVSSILNQGLKGSKTNGNSFTRKVMEDTGVKDFEPFKNKSYLAKTKTGAKATARARFMTENPKSFADLLNPLDYNKRMKMHIKNNTKTLKASIPVNEYAKIKQVANPELRGAKSAKEFAKKLKGVPESELDKRLAYHILGRGTVTVDGDFAAKHFKGGKGYAKNSLKQVAKHMKDNPKMALKGAGLMGGGALLAGVGAKTIGKNVIAAREKNVARKNEDNNDPSVKRFNELSRKLY